MLINFNRVDLSNNSDHEEKIGNVGLGLLHIGFGRTVTINKISNDDMAFIKKSYPIPVKVAAVALFILAFPITVPLAVMGCIGMAFSKSYSEVFNLYNQIKQKSAMLGKKSNAPDAELVRSTAVKKTKSGKKILPLSHSNTPEDKAATSIQKHFRGYLARRPFLSNHLYPQYRVLCDQAERAGHRCLMPNAGNGRTTVFLPQQMPGVVLKQSGRKEAIERFHQMQEARSVLYSQKSSHLIIPEANLCQNFLVEKRLPVNVDSYANMQIYLSDPKLFDEPVRELTRLFSTVDIGDLIATSKRSPLRYISGNNVRYDNLPLYVVEKNGKMEGKIGLIDLEYFKNSPSADGLETVVRIFPLHLDIIKEEATKLKMEFDEGRLETAAEKGKKYLEVGFASHLKWLKQKGIDTNHLSSQPFQVSPQREKELITVIEKELLKLNQGVNHFRSRWNGNSNTIAKNFFIENPEATAKELAATILPLMIGRIKTRIERHQNEQLTKFLDKKMTEAQLISSRSFEIERIKLCRDVLKETHVAYEKLKVNEISIEEKRDLSDQLLYVVLENLVKGGEIFYFDPGYSSSNRECWIRF